MSMMDMKDRMSKNLYGRTITEAWEKGICVCHGEPIDETKLAERDAREYRISGLCPRAWKEMADFIVED